MSSQAIANFEITTWDETTYDEPADGPKLTRVTVKKRFSGDLRGESTAELLTTQGEDGSAGYLASERVEGALVGLSGTFVLNHGGTVRHETPVHWYGVVVPGSGTGELRGLRGDAVYQHGASGAILTLEYEID